MSEWIHVFLGFSRLQWHGHLELKKWRNDEARARAAKWDILVKTGKVEDAHVNEAIMAMKPLLQTLMLR
jgi:hypothetical protein